MPMSELFQKRLFPLLPQIIEKFGTPFHIYDAEGILGSLNKLQDAFARVELPFKEFYAVKALPKPAIMELLYKGGAGFDCSSIPELRLARNAGAQSQDIMFTSNNTSQEEFEEAQLFGGCILNLDDEIFIDEVPEPFPKLISFRLNPGDQKTGDEVNSIIGDPKDSKYGVPIERILAAYDRASRNGARGFGLHTMVCSNDLDYRHMVSTVRILLDVAWKLRHMLNIELEFINMGGGIGIPYRPGEEEFNVNALAEECRNLVDNFKKDCGYIPKLCMESGRYVTGPHGVLVNPVLNVYRKYKDIVGIHTAMPALMRVGMYPKAYHHCVVLNPDGTVKDGPTKKYTIAGPICENCDALANGIILPEVRVGDLIVTHDTGAHGSAMGFNYNGRCRPQELLLNRLHTTQADYVTRICRAETYEDLERRHLDLDGKEHKLLIHSREFTTPLSA